MKRWFLLTTATMIARFFYWLSRFMGLGEGSNIPGRIVAQIFPNILRVIVPRFKRGWILITGTNGKTTTTKILTEVMRECGFTVVTNAMGANLISGIITSIFLAKVQPARKFMADYAVFEIDEAVLIKTFHLFQPNFLVVTNFSRDQLDRYGEVDSNVNRIMELVRNAGYPCKVILNGNDPNVARIGSVVNSDNRIYFGIKGEASSPETGLLIENDTGKGLDAGTDLPELDFWAEVLQGNYLDGSRFILGHQQRTMEVGIKLPGVFNILNALAATSVGYMLNGDLEKIVSWVGKVEPSYGRSELFRFDRFPVFLFLVKNPVGFNHIIQLLSQAYGEKRVLLLLNDLTADGADVSWIWDIELENLWKVKGIHEIVTSGARAGDMALRVKYSNSTGIPLTVDYSPKRAFRDLASRIKEGEEMLVLANYTSMIQFRPFLLKNCRSQNVI